MPKLSVCIIARNEERYIEGCLDSVKPVADELIVVDTGSTDKTVKLAKAGGAKVFFHEWQDDFSAARNFALNKAGGDWVLQIDADETLYERDKDLFSRLMAEKQADSFVCQIVNLTEPDSFNGATIHGYPRFFRARAHRYSGAIHEQLVRDHEHQGSSLWSGIHIVHWGYLDREAELAKGKRNLIILEKSVQENPHSALLHFYLGRERVRAGELDRAVTSFDEAEALRPIGDIGLLALIVIERCRCLIELDRVDDALEQLEWARESFFDYRDVHYMAGQAYFKKGEWEEALDCFERCSHMPTVSPTYPLTVEGLDRIAEHAVKACLQRLGRNTG